MELKPERKTPEKRPHILFVVPLALVFGWIVYSSRTPAPQTIYDSSADYGGVQVRAMAFLPDNSSLLFSQSILRREDPKNRRTGDDQFLMLISIQKATIRHWKAQDGPVDYIAFLPDGKQVVTQEKDGRVKLWDVRRERVVRDLGPGYAGGIEPPISADGRFAHWAYASKPDHFDRVRLTVEIRDILSERLVRSVQVDQVAKRHRVALSPDGRLFVSEEKDIRWETDHRFKKQWLRIWDRTAQGKAAPIAEYPHFQLPGCFSPDGRYAYLVGNQFKSDDASESELVKWDTTTGKIVRPFAHCGHPVRLSYSPDGRYVYRGDAKLLMNVQTGEPEWFKDGYSAFAWSSDGKQFATARGGMFFDGKTQSRTSVYFEVWDADALRKLKCWDLDSFRLGPVYRFN